MQKTHNKWKELGTSSFLIKKQKHRETHLSKNLCPESKTFASISFNWQLFEHKFEVMSCAESADSQKQNKTEIVFKTLTSRTIQHQPNFH